MRCGNTVCTACPRNCRIDRDKRKGLCGMGNKLVVAKAFLHKWEEPCVSGNRGSGTVFFSGCNLKCVYCQNHSISQKYLGREISVEQLRKIYLSLQEKGAHNINLVSPTHFISQIKDSLTNSDRLKIPVIYNSNAYESLESLTSLEGMIDVYLPDLKYYNDEVGRKYSGVNDYFCTATFAILEMYRQVGKPVFDDEGIIQKGLILRHLVLPGLTGDSIKILDWIKENLPEDILISLMCQYLPCHKAEEYPEINRRITKREYERVVNHLFKLGLENGYVQERDSAKEEYIPDFDFEGI